MFNTEETTQQTKDRKTDQTSLINDPLTFGNSEANKFFKKLEEAITEKRNEKISSLHRKLRKILKALFKINDHALYSNVIQQLAQFCITAYQKHQIEKIQMVLGLTDEEILEISEILKQKNYKLLTFLLINNDRLEEFSEDSDLKKDKNEIQKFKTCLYENLAQKQADCRPNTQDIEESAQLFKKLVHDRLENIKQRRPSLELFTTSWLNKAVFEFLYFQNDYQTFFKLYHKILCDLIELFKDDEFQSKLKLYFSSEMVEKELNLLLDERAMPYIICNIARETLGEIAHANNIDFKAIIDFNQNIEIEAFQKRDNISNTLSLDSKTFFQWIHYVFLACTQDNAKEVAKLLFEISKYLMADVNRIKTLVMLDDDFNKGLEKDSYLEDLSKSDRLDLFVYILVNKLLKPLARHYNMPQVNILSLQKRIIEEISQLLKIENRPTLLRPIEDIIANINPYLSLYTKNGQTYILENLMLDLKIQFEHAFLHKDMQYFASLVQNVSKMLLDAHLSQNLAILFKAAKIVAPELIATVSEVLDTVSVSSTENNALLLAHLNKAIVNYVIKQLNTDSSVRKPIVKRFKTKAKLNKVIYDVTQANLKFQETIYQALGLSSNDKDNKNEHNTQTEENLVKEQDENLKLVKTFKESLKTHFEASQPQLFAENAQKIISFIKNAFEKGLTAKAVNLIEKSLTEKSFAVNLRPSINLSFLINLLEKPEYANLFNFVFLDNINFESLYGYSIEKMKNVAGFKAKVLDYLNKNNPIKLPETSVLKEQFQIIQKDKTGPTALFLTNVMRAYWRYLFLDNQNNVGNKRASQIYRESANLLALFAEHADCLQDISVENYYESILAMEFRDALQRLDFKTQHSLKPTIAWVLLNSMTKKGVCLDNYAKQNGIVFEQINDYKLHVTQKLALIWNLNQQNDSLLQNAKTLQLQIEKLFTTKQTSKNPQENSIEISNIPSFTLQGSCLLIEQMLRGDVEGFLESIQIIFEIINANKNDFLQVSALLDLDYEEFNNLCLLLNNKQEALAKRYLIEVFDITNSCLIENAMPASKLLAFLQTVFEKFSSQEGFSLKLPLREEKISTELELKILSQKMHCMAIELGLLLQDAYYFNNPKLFAQTIERLKHLVQDAYKNTLLEDLIELLHLNSENAYLESNYKAFIPALGLASEISVESIIQALESNNLNGLTKLFIDSFMKKFSTTFLGYTLEAELMSDKKRDDANFKEKVYEALNIIPLDLYNPRLIDLEKEKDFLAVSIQKLANQGVNLRAYERSLEVFAKIKPIVDALPKPTTTDTQAYHKLHAEMLKIWHNHLLAHRFGISGKFLEGSFSITMAEELQRAVKELESSANIKLAFEQAKKLYFSDTNEKNWHKTIEQINLDIANVVLKAENVISKSVDIDQTIAFPLFLTFPGEEMGHLAGVIFFKFNNKHYCVLSDRSEVITKYSGLVFHEVKYPENIANAIAIMAKMMSTNNLTVSDFKESIKRLKLQALFKIGKKYQKSGNCGWSSSAKMLYHAIAMANLLKLLEKNNFRFENQAFILANKATTHIYKVFTADDRLAILKQNLAYCKSSNTPPHSLMLTTISLKSQNRAISANVQKELGNANLDIDTYKQSALAELQSYFNELLLGSSKVENPAAVSLDLLNKYSQDILEAYLKNDKKTVEFLMNKAIAEIQTQYSVKKSAEEENKIEEKVEQITLQDISEIEAEIEKKLPKKIMAKEVNFEMPSFQTAVLFSIEANNTSGRQSPTTSVVSQVREGQKGNKEKLNTT